MSAIAFPPLLRRVGATMLVVGAACGAPKELPRKVALGNPVRLDHPFDGVDRIVELSDGRVLVLDTLARAVDVADFSTREVNAVGQHGTGPGQYSAPDWLIPIPGRGDTTLIDDAPMHRYAIVVGAVLQAGSIARDAAAPMIRAADSTGHAYTQPDLDAHDSVPLVRVDRRRGTADTIALLSTGRHETEVPHFFALVKLPPYPKNDTWGVLPDGTVLIARIATYHLQVLEPGGQRREGDWVDFGRIRNEWGDSEPPFVSAPTSLDRVSPTGVFWVERTTPEHERPERYDLFDAKGQMLREVELPAGARLVGVGRRFFYATTRDSAGPVYLERLEQVDRRITGPPGAR